MKTRSVIIALGAVLAVAAAPAADTGAEPTTPHAQSVQVGTDPADDWGASDEEQAVGDALGQELTGATVGMPDAETVEFVIKLNSLPPIGGTPEVTRYTWNFEVDGTFFELDGKYTNYSRGACDPTSGQCDPANDKPPRDPGMQPFFLRGNCTTNDANVTTCEELANIQAEFDQAAATITIPVPTELLSTQPCSTISPGANLFGGSVSAAPSAYFTTSASPMDTMSLFAQTPGDTFGTFTVPSDDPVEDPCYPEEKSQDGSMSG